MKFSGFLALRVLNAVRILKTVEIQRQCSGATLVALPTAWNAAPAAYLANITLLIILLSCPPILFQTASAHPDRLYHGYVK